MPADLSLVPLTIDHAADFLPIWSDREVTRFTYVRDVATLADCRARIAWILEHGSDVGPFVLQSGGQVVGLAGAVRLPQPGEFSAYYHLARQYWGQGLGSNALAALLHCLFLECDARCVRAEAVKDNPASWRLMERNGMRRTGLQPGGFARDGAVYDLFDYAIHREAFLHPA